MQIIPFPFPFSTQTLSENMYIFYGYRDTNRNDAIKYINSSNSWVVNADQPNVDHGRGVCRVDSNNTLIFTGDTRQYSISGNSYTSKASLSVRVDMAYSNLGSYCMSFGGWTGSSTSSEIKGWVENSWSSYVSLPVGIKACRAFTINGLAYITGGENRNTNYEFNRSSNTLTTKANLLQNTGWHSCGNIYNTGYIAGGKNSSGYLSNTVKYVNDTWTNVIDILNPLRSHASIGSLNNRLFLVQGLSSTGSYIRDNDEYFENTWTSKTDASSSVYFTGGVGV